MNINDVWNLFKITGKVEYFLKYKDMQSKGMSSIGDSEGNRDSNQ